MKSLRFSSSEDFKSYTISAINHLGNLPLRSLRTALAKADGYEATPAYCQALDAQSHDKNHSLCDIKTPLLNHPAFKLDDGKLIFCAKLLLKDIDVNDDWLNSGKMTKKYSLLMVGHNRLWITKVIKLDLESIYVEAYLPQEISFKNLQDESIRFFRLAFEPAITEVISEWVEFIDSDIAGDLMAGINCDLKIKPAFHEFKSQFSTPFICNAIDNLPIKTESGITDFSRKILEKNYVKYVKAYLKFCKELDICPQKYSSFTKVHEKICNKLISDLLFDLLN
jgi:hypothetical protein